MTLTHRTLSAGSCDLSPAQLPHTLQVERCKVRKFEIELYDVSTPPSWLVRRAGGTHDITRDDDTHGGAH